MRAGDLVIVIDDTGLVDSIRNGDVFRIKTTDGEFLTLETRVGGEKVAVNGSFLAKRFVPFSPAQPSSSGTDSSAKKNDDGKPQYDILLSINGLHRVSNCFSLGAKKYEDPFNFRKGDEKFKKRLVSATVRHVIEYLKGNKLDPEDNESHIAHAISNLMMILDLEEK